MSGHTPGPWRADDHGYIWGRSVGGCNLIESDHVVAQVRGWGHLKYRKDGATVQDANAQLLAQAPDLLAERDRLRARVESLARAADAAEKALTPTLSNAARKLLAGAAEAERACGDQALADAIEFILEQHERRSAALTALREARNG